MWPTWGNIHNPKVYKLKSLRPGRNTKAKNIKKEDNTSNLTLIFKLHLYVFKIGYFLGKSDKRGESRF